MNVGRLSSHASKRSRGADGLPGSPGLGFPNRPVLQGRFNSLLVGHEAVSTAFPHTALALAEPRGNCRQGNARSRAADSPIFLSRTPWPGGRLAPLLPHRLTYHAASL